MERQDEMTRKSASIEPIAAASAGGSPVEHGADPVIDRLNLEQALLDFEVANRRVVDLARRVSSLQRELLETRNELARKSAEADALLRLAARLRASRLFPFARRLVRATRGLSR
jgi:hypothetical protein